jgi:adenosine deaminase
MAFDVSKKEKLSKLHFLEMPLCDLHIHVGASVAPHIMWSIAHQQGLRLTARNYWEFHDMITVSDDKVTTVEEYLNILHTWTEKIQSSPAAMERCTYEIISKEYRGSNVTRIELRFNPMKRNLGGERDLDHILHAAIRGMDQAVMEFGCEAGLILCMAREFRYDLNEIIVEKAMRFRDRGVIGIDLAGPENDPLENDPVLISHYASLLDRAKKAGLKVTLHTGETEHTGPEGVATAIRKLKPDRVGHGIQSAHSEETMKIAREEGVTLEVCPSSNLWCNTAKGIEELTWMLQRFKEYRVPFTICTDGTYLLKTDLMNEYKLLHENKVLTEEQLNDCVRQGWSSSFLS